MKKHIFVSLTLLVCVSPSFAAPSQDPCGELATLQTHSRQEVVRKIAEIHELASACHNRLRVERYEVRLREWHIALGVENLAFYYVGEKLEMGGEPFEPFLHSLSQEASQVTFGFEFYGEGLEHAELRVRLRNLEDSSRHLGVTLPNYCSGASRVLKTLDPVPPAGVATITVPLCKGWPFLSMVIN